MAASVDGIEGVADEMQPTNSRGNNGRCAFLLLFGWAPARLFNRFAGSGQGEKNEPVHASRLFGLDILIGVEPSFEIIFLIRYRACNAHGKLAERLDLANARLTVEQAVSNCSRHSRQAEKRHPFP
ncbi:hypothetical protein D9M68_750190 [compost metagenome]